MSERRYEDFETDRDLMDENDYDQFPQDDYPQDSVHEEPYDEGRYRQEVVNNLVVAIQEYMGFSTMRDLIKLINENV